MVTFTNLVSGAIGAVIGSFATFIIYRHSQYMASRRKLLNRLELLRHGLQGGTYPLNKGLDGTTPKTWNESFKIIMTLYNSVMDWAPFYRKCRIQKAWEQYKNDTIDGHETFLTEPENDKEFIDRIDTFIKSLS